MKKACCLCAMVLFTWCSVSFGKIVNPETFSLSGSTSLEFSDSTTKYDSRGYDDFDNTEINIECDFYRYFQPNMGIGLMLSYQDSDAEQGDEKVEETFWMIGPAVEVQVEMNEKTNLFFQLAIGLMKGDSEASDSYSSVDADIDGTAWQIGAGIKHFFNKNVALNAALVYESADLEYDRGATSVDIDLTSTSLRLGFSLYF